MSQLLNLEKNVIFPAKYERSTDLDEKLHTVGNIIESLKDKNEKYELLELIVDKLSLFELCTISQLMRETKSNIPKSKRLGIYPIEDFSSWERVKKMESTLWVSEEVKFVDDVASYEKFSEDEKRPLLFIFGFFAVGDGTVGEALLNYLIDCSSSAEERAFYNVQNYNEQTHNETYGRMILTLVRSKEERVKLFDAVSKVQSIKAMNSFIENVIRYPDGKRQIYISLIIAEFVMFIPLFSVLYWYKAYKKGSIKFTL